MKKIIIVLILTSVFLNGCDSTETANVSKVTHYPTVSVLGDETIFLAQGDAFIDPGAIAMEGENEIPTTVTYHGNYRGANTLDTNITDEYVVTYTATNADGFKAAASRTLIVYKTGDLINSIEGVYVSTVLRNGTPLPPSQGSSIDMKYIYIWKNNDGTYEVSDAFGGWYSLGRHLGLNFITPGGTINAIDIPTNNFTFPGNPLTNLNFGGTANITGLTVDPTEKKVILTTSWLTEPPVTSYTFVSTLIQEQL